MVAGGGAVAGTANAQPRPAIDYPCRAARVELVGQMDGMAYADRRWLICLDGSQYVQATELLFHLLRHADGATSVEEIARRVSAETGRAVSGEEIRWLVVNRLATSGLIDWPDASVPQAAGAAKTPPRAQPAAPILAVKHRFPLFPYPVTAPAAAVLEHLFWPPLIVLVVLAAAAVNVWILRGADLVNGVVTLFFRPELVLFLFAVDTVTRLFHELGHASALRRAGARHGDIGFALYVIFPVYYTDVTHAYRLTRAQRIRVDLGGIYSDLISMLGLYVAYRFTGYTPLLLMITLIGLGILRQFTPFMRFDGYYLIADLMGVPEPMSLIVPFIRDHLPWRQGRSRTMPELHRAATAILAAYLLLIVAFVSRPFLLLGIAGGAAVQALPRSGAAILSEFLFAWRNHDVLTQVAATLELVFWLLIPIGFALFLAGLARLLVRSLLLLGRVAATRIRVAVARPAAVATAPAAPPAPPAPVAQRNVPTPLDGLGRPVAQAEAAALRDVSERVAAIGDPSVQALAEELSQVYGRRLDLVSAEMRRVVEWTERIERERDGLAGQVAALQASVARLSADLRRIGGEMIAAADAAGGTEEPGAPERLPRPAAQR